jgi:hypothetical protein
MEVLGKSLPEKNERSGEEFYSFIGEELVIIHKKLDEMEVWSFYIR